MLATAFPRALSRTSDAPDVTPLRRAKGRLFALPLALPLALLLALPAGLAPAGAWALERATLSVEGRGVVEVAPDMAVITLGVTAHGKQAREALDLNTSRMTETLRVLNEAGIAPRDVQTLNLSLNPVWEGRRNGPETPPEITGFQARNTVTVRIRDLAKLGSILDAVVSAGANEFQGLSFGLQDPEDTKDEARRRAVADARRKAELYAMAAGQQLGKLVSMNESADRSGPRPMMMEMARSSGPAPIAEGELSVEAGVSVIYELE